jgi:hypothetical protein
VDHQDLEALVFDKALLVLPQTIQQFFTLLRQQFIAWFIGEQG